MADCSVGFVGGLAREFRVPRPTPEFKVDPISVGRLEQPGDNVGRGDDEYVRIPFGDGGGDGLNDRTRRRADAVAGDGELRERLDTRLVARNRQFERPDGGWVQTGFETDPQLPRDVDVVTGVRTRAVKLLDALGDRANCTNTGCIYAQQRAWRRPERLAVWRCDSTPSDATLLAVEELPEVRKRRRQAVSRGW